MLPRGSWVEGSGSMHSWQYALMAVCTDGSMHSWQYALMAVCTHPSAPHGTGPSRLNATGPSRHTHLVDFMHTS